MLVKILPRRQLVDFIGPFLMALVVLTFILLMDRLFLMIDLLVRKGISAPTVGELVLLSMPFTMTVSTPLAMLIAAVMSYGRASHDNEIAALRTAGIPAFRVTIPLMIAGAALCGVMVYFNGYVAADSSFRMRNLMMDLATKKPALRIEPGVFLQDFEGYTIYIGAMDEKTSRIRDVRIYDHSQSGVPDLIVAPRGIIGSTPDEKYLTLTLDSGAVHQYLGEGKYRRMEFKEHVINLPYNEDLVRKDREYRGNAEMTLSGLATRMKSARNDLNAQGKIVKGILQKGKLLPGDSMRLDEERTKFRFKHREMDRLNIEVNKRYSLAFSCFLFLFFGAPVGILLRRGGMGIGFLVGLIFFAVFYILLLAGEEMANSGRLSPFVGMWLGNLLLFPVTVELSARTFFEYSFVQRIVRFRPVRNVISKIQNPK
jgi:lipopolysaccharide export system permease protein